MSTSLTATASKKTPVRKKTNKSLFRRINDWLHLWLGLSSGLIVLIVSITGCIYAFEREIREFTQPYQFVPPQQQAYLLPSQLRSIAAKEAFGNKADSAGNHILGITYGTANRAAIAAFMHKKDGYSMIYINPYTGQVLKKKALNNDFFRIILNGHFYLWLPPKIGQPVVATAILIFVILLISGLIMWWPKKWNKANRDKSFKVKWKAGFKRVNYDLHNVLGFYVLLLAFAIAVTGLVWGFKWFSQSYYWALSGGKSFPKAQKIMSDTTLSVTTAATIPNEDLLWQRALQEYGTITGALQIQFPEKRPDAYFLNYNPQEGTYYKREFRYFDRTTLKELPVQGMYAKKYSEIGAGEKIYRMNYDIHVGAVAGLPGKCIAFFASFICASLPVTGFYIWWGKKKKKKPAQKKQVVTVTVKTAATASVLDT